MQSVKKIQELLDSAGARPMGRFGQCFLIDLNYMKKVVETADFSADDTLLEVGPGTGSLTEELIAGAAKVVTAEIDRKFCEMLRRYFADEPKFSLVEGDALAGKHAINPDILNAVGQRCSLVANLPYNIATPLVIEMLLESCRSLTDDSHVCFERLTFTVQKEVADRLCSASEDDYGIVSVIVSLMGNVRPGADIPPQAFWPRPKVVSQIVRIDFDPQKAAKIRSLETLQKLLHLAFTQRRKKLSAAARARGAAFSQQQIIAAMARANVDPETRGQELTPDDFLNIANALEAMDN